MTIRQSILFIENEPELFSVLKVFLKKLAKPHIFAVTSGKEAMKTLKNHHIDLLIIDTDTMPGSGTEFINELHKQYRQLKIIMVIDHEEQVIQEQALADGIGYIDKLFDIKEFVALVQQYLRPQKSNGIDLRRMSLFDFLQLIEMNKTSLLLKITKNHEDVGKIFFDKGAVVHATMGQKIGKEAVYEMMSWKEGIISSAQLPKQFPTTISCSTSSLIMETLEIIGKQENELKCLFQLPKNPPPNTLKKNAPAHISFTSTLTGTPVPSLSIKQKEIIMTLQEIQEQFKAEIQGFISAVVVDTQQALLLAGTSADKSFDMTVPAGFFNETFRSAITAFNSASWGVPEDMLLSGKNHNIVVFSLKDSAYWQGICISKATPVGMALARFRAVREELEKALP